MSRLESLPIENSKIESSKIENHHTESHPINNQKHPINNQKIDSYKIAKLCVPSSAKRAPLKRLSIAFRVLFLYSSTIKEINQFFSKDRLRSYIFALPDFKRHIYNQQIRSCFFRRSSGKERFHFLTSHFQFLEATHSEDTIKKIYTQSITPITFEESDTRLSFTISYDNVIAREGLLQLSMMMNNEVLYKITFWFMDYHNQPVLCIGALQGGKNTLETNRLFTKNFWGMRPQNMALTVLKWYASSLSIEKIFTFPQERLWCKKISEQTAINELWEEQGATPVPNSPFLQMDTLVKQKDIQEISTRKRSMYKKRYEFLARLHVRIGQVFNSYQKVEKYNNAKTA